MENTNLSALTAEAVDLLCGMIRIPAYSYQEEARASFLQEYLTRKSASVSLDLIVERIKNNLILRHKQLHPDKPLLMLCSHIDTVKEVAAYTIPPFEPIEKEGCIYGLGSNDDGGSVVSQCSTFFHLLRTETSREALPVNLMLVLTAEEERSGSNGMDHVMQELETRKLLPDFAIVGEPTGMQAAVAERGLLVLDCTASGVSGHAARNEGINALYIALDDIRTLRNFPFAKHSPLMGSVKLTVTQLSCGEAHNVVPDKATFVVDIRPTEQYNNPELVELLQKELKSKIIPRNLTNRTSATPQGHPLYRTAEKLGITTYISPTTSDWMRLPVPSIKMGPGESARSHRADEYIRIEEIREGIKGYITFIQNLQTGK